MKYHTGNVHMNAHSGCKNSKSFELTFREKNEKDENKDIVNGKKVWVSIANFCVAAMLIKYCKQLRAMLKQTLSKKTHWS